MIRRLRPWLAGCLLGALLPLISPTSLLIASAVVSNPSASCSAGTCTVTFSDSTDYYDYTVPSGLTSLDITIKGGKGGGSSGGAGGVVTGRMNVSGGTVLRIYVGGEGAQGTSPSGGKSGGRNSGGNILSGQRSDNRSGGGHSEVSLTNGTSIVIAGGGGGHGGWSGGSGGAGGGTSWSGVSGGAISSGANGASGQASGGTGGSSSAGTGGGGYGSGSSGSSGSGQVGGNGGAGTSGNAHGGGGGGGYRGGGGGGGDSDTCCADGGGGGGGSSYYNSSYFSSAPTTSQGGNAAAGSIVLSYPSTAVSSFASSQASPTNTNSLISYTLTMSETVTGMSSADFQNGGSATGCIFAVSGSGNSYALSVTSCGEGTLTPQLKANSVTGTTTGPAETSSATTTITIDRTAPTISSVDSPSATTYGPGTNINFTVRFSESVTVTGTPRLSLTVGSTQRYANFVSLSDSKTATFRYTVQTDANDIDTDGISVSSTLDSNSSTIADLASNQLTSFTFTPPSLTAVKVAQRAAAPTITSITGANASLSIAFTAGSDNGSAITNYEFSTNGGTLFTAFSPVDTTTPLSVTGLNNGTPYSVKIRALTSLNGSSTAGESSTTVIGTPSAAPAASVVPSISGTVSVGSRLTADKGTWTNSPTSYTYRWVRSQTVDGTYTAITNATSDSYTIVSGDNSYFIKVAVTATNASGSKTETSSATTQVKVPISISGGSNISTTAGIAASSSAFTTSGGYGSINLAVSGARPEVSISGGVVTASSSLPAGSYTETITATDSLGDTASTTMSISVLSEISAPAFTVSRGTSVGSFKLTFSPVTGAASYTVKVYRSIDDFASPIATITNYVSGSDIQDGDPSSGCSGATPICFGIGTSRTFKFTVTPIASSGYTSTGESAKSSKYGMYKAYGASLTTATSGTVGLDITDSYYNYNTGKSGVIAYIYSRASNYTTVFETASIVGTSWNRIAVPSGETYTVALKHLGATVGDTVWFDSDISPQTSGIFVFNKPNAPSDISAVRTGSGSIQVNWTAASGPYQAYYVSSSTDGSNWTSRGSTSSDSITITGLTNGTAYYIRIYNFGSGTYARASDYVVMSGTITPATTPGPIASGTSSMSDSRIDITWTAPSDNGGSAITGYLIEYSATSATYNESITALASDTRLAITALTNGLSYYVRIKALNSVGEGSAVDYAAGSAILVKGTAGSTVGAVTSITRTSATLSATINARGNTTTPTLTWGLVDGSQTDITLTAVTSDNVSVTSNISGLLPGRRYQVTSSVNPGTSQDVGGRPIYFTTNPDSVTSVSYTSTTSALTVSWTAMASGNGYGFSYDVTLSLNGNAVGSGCANITASSGGRSSCTLSGLTANTTYSVSITASITGGDYGNGASEAYILSAATDPNIATITLNVNSGNHTIARGSTINIVATTNVAGAVTFKANGREIKECKQKATSSLQATCSWRPSTHGTVTFNAFFNPTSNQYTNVTSAKTSVLMTRRTSRS